jgi:hypothetical protein
MTTATETTVMINDSIKRERSTVCNKTKVVNALDTAKPK